MDNNQDIKIQGVDLASGIARFANKKELYFKSLKNFVAELPETWDDFNTIVTDEDKTKFAQRVHTLKGVSGNLSMTEMYENTVAFEKKIREGIFLEEDYTAWFEMCKRIKGEIGKVLAQRENGAGAQTTVADRQKFTAMLRELAVALDVCQTSKCDRIVTELKANRWSGVNTVLLNKMYAYIDAYDYDNAIYVINELLKFEG